MGLLVIPLVFLVLGLVVGRWWVVAASIVVWGGIAVFLVANDGWYGHGWGDGGILLNVIAAALTVLAAAVGVAGRSLGARLVA